MSRWTLAGILVAMVLGAFEAMFRLVCRSD